MMTSVLDLFKFAWALTFLLPLSGHRHAVHAIECCSGTNAKKPKMVKCSVGYGCARITKKGKSPEWECAQKYNLAGNTPELLCWTSTDKKTAGEMCTCSRPTCNCPSGARARISVKLQPFFFCVLSLGLAATSLPFTHVL